jgi:hypothetical protein
MAFALMQEPKIAPNPGAKAPIVAKVPAKQPEKCTTPNCGKTVDKAVTKTDCCGSKVKHSHKAKKHKRHKCCC